MTVTELKSISIDPVIALIRSRRFVNDVRCTVSAGSLLTLCSLISDERD